MITTPSHSTSVARRRWRCCPAGAAGLEKSPACARLRMYVPAMETTLAYRMRCRLGTAAKLMMWAGIHSLQGEEQGSDGWFVEPVPFQGRSAIAQSSLVAGNQRARVLLLHLACVLAAGRGAESQAEQ